MQFRYDAEVDILMIEIAADRRERFARGRKLSSGDAVIDLDADGNVLAIEILDASKKYSMQSLKAHPAQYEPLTLADAAVIAGSTVEALRKAIQRGRLKARQIGRSWVVDGPALDDYLNSRWHREPASVG